MRIKANVNDDTVKQRANEVQGMRWEAGSLYILKPVILQLWYFQLRWKKKVKSVCKMLQSKSKDYYFYEYKSQAC